MRDYIFNKVLSTLLIIQVVFIGFISRRPEWVESIYSKGLYPIISRFFRRILGWIPFSIGDVLYLILVLIIIRWIWLLIRTRLSPIKAHIYAAGAFVSIMFFSFHLLWGLNYYRLPFYQRLGIDNLNYTSKDLQNTTIRHIENLNSLHSKLAENDSLAVEIPYKKRTIYKMAGKEYKELNIDTLDLHFKTRSIKNSLLSIPLSYMGFSGYLNPFTSESQVNRKIPKTIFPATVCHEMAHQLGYASEDEANYIGYLTCKNSSDLYFQFSGELMAVNHLLYSLSGYEEELYKEYKDLLHIGVLKNYQNNRDFWDSYQTPVEPFFKHFYDAYLKANRQKEGIDSYNGMVGYLVKDFTE